MSFFAAFSAAFSSHLVVGVRALGCLDLDMFLDDLEPLGGGERLDSLALRFEAEAGAALLSASELK